MPERIQLSRRKGWRKPEGAVVVSRPSKWGNPFSIAAALDWEFASTKDDARRVCVEAYRDWLRKGRRSDWWFENGAKAWEFQSAHLSELAGKDLACWCPPDAECHADVLLELANREVGR